MKQFRFEAEVVCAEDVPREVVRERVYGGVRVTAEWPRELVAPEMRLAIDVAGELDFRDAPAYVELFFHDVFLLLNLAAPGSFGGTISISGDALRVRELTFSARVFEYAALRDRLPLDDVIAWYDGLAIGTRQLAHDGVTTALFQLLHLARTAEEEEISILRLARAAEGLLGARASLRRLFELRDELAHGLGPVFHPMQDDGLDAAVRDATEEWIEIADAAAAVVIGELRERVRPGGKA
ncbi:MAG TPA: hypothetical protein VGF48_13790 [Thermoanaerobaculia bacterium]|jgi:hypothetical protein